MNRPAPWKAIAPVALALLAAAALPAQAAKPKAGTWQGHVDGGGSVQFKIREDGGKLELAKGRIENAKTTCTAIVTGGTRDDTVSSKIYGVVKVRHGKFSYEGTGAATERFKGKFTSKKKATGTFFYDYFHGGEDCTTGKVHWSAKR